MSDSFDLHDVDLLTVGTVGEPGNRVFYLQAKAGPELVTLKLEKQQVKALADSVQNVLADLPQPGDLPTELELVEPIEAAWAVAVLGLGYDEATDRIVLVARAAGFAPDDDEGDDEGDDEDDDLLAVLARRPGDQAASARFTATREQVAALAIRGRLLVESGRPPCPVCGYPLESGHVCPRLNGHRPPKL